MFWGFLNIETFYLAVPHQVAGTLKLLKHWASANQLQNLAVFWCQSVVALCALTTGNNKLQIEE